MTDRSRRPHPTHLLALLAAAAAACPTGAAQTPSAPVAAAAPSPDARPACASAAPARPPVGRIAPDPVANPGPPLPAATSPIAIRPRKEAKHACFLEVARRGGIDLLFVGDSITDFFGRADRGEAVWNARFAPLKAANFGISGDTTQEVLWRMQNGELSGYRAKLIVLMLGTNNIGRNANADIVAGDAAIVAEFRKQQPGAKILLLGVFPRQAEAAAPARAAVREINAGLARLADNRHVFFRDIGTAFLQPDGTLSPDAMVDGLHPSDKGYRLWADAIAADVRRLMR